MLNNMQPLKNLIYIIILLNILKHTSCNITCNLNKHNFNCILKYSIRY